jgi:hypothetical protein
MNREAFSFDEVRQAEVQLIEEARAASGTGAKNVAHDLFGLAFSGGGIRSATFNLGVLQALARARLLRRVDYLSTVSGGGYIGSWLSAWILRANRDVRSVEKALAESVDQDSPEPTQLSWLRRFSNYLTPRLGLFSTDTLAGAATYVRNLLLNLFQIVALVGAALMLPLLAAWVLTHAQLQWLAVGVLAFAVALFVINLNLYHSDVAREKVRFYQSRKSIFWLVVVPLIVAAATLGLAAARRDAVSVGEFLARYFVPALALSIGLQVAAWLMHKWTAGGTLSSVGSAVREALRTLGKPGAANRPAQYYYGPADWLRILLGVTLAVVVGLLGLWAIGAVLADGATRPTAVLHATVWSMPGALVAFGLATILFVGIVGRTFSEETREWWSRLGGWMLGVTAAWLAVACAAVYGPFLLGWLQGWAAEAGAAWILSTAAGVLAGRSRLTSGKEGKRTLEWIANLAPYVFVLGLLLAVSYLLHGTLRALAVGGADAFELHASFGPYARATLSVIDADRLPALLGILTVLLAVVFGLSWTVDVNVFSLHMFYRNRLVRCYLGATSEGAGGRRAHPFTGFDPADSPRVSDLAGQRPYHLINTALNLTRSNNLAWQERKAASFVIAPLYCGYDLEPRAAAAQGRYQCTAQYLKPVDGDPQSPGGWLGLGTALTISGAAASPNMGHHTATATAFLLTVFNVRLGWWMQNSASRGHWARKGPRFGILWLLRELFALTDESRPFVYLSDGGHFENLGIYELVRRRCRFILAVDAGQDRDFRFEDLGNAVRKCAVDLGVEIAIDTRALVPDPQTRRSRFHCTVGEIRYPDNGKEPRTGLLLYVKPSLTGNEPADIAQYAASHAQFPHESTADQWFAESQFESYRKLGLHVMSAILESVGEREELRADAGVAIGVRDRDLEGIFVKLKERWHPPGRAAAAFTRHGDRLRFIEQALRTDQKLRFMDAQLSPEWPRLAAGRPGAEPVWLGLPKDYESLRSGFYLCTSMLQVMEEVYLDLNLEEEWEHPDNRGWMNLFKHWSWSAMFMVTFSICCGMYGARFQRWCERRLDLGPGKVAVAALDVPRPQATVASWLDELEKRNEINFVEAAMVKDYLEPGDKLLLLQLSQEVSPSFPPHRGDHGPLLVYTFGLAAAREVQGAAGKEHRLTFFRIQDHVRRMGLARRAMRALVGDAALRLAGSALDRDFPQKGEIERILNSVVRETAAASGTA